MAHSSVQDRHREEAHDDECVLQHKSTTDSHFAGLQISHWHDSKQERTDAM